MKAPLGNKAVQNKADLYRNGGKNMEKYYCLDGMGMSLVCQVPNT